MDIKSRIGNYLVHIVDLIKKMDNWVNKEAIIYRFSYFLLVYSFFMVCVSYFFNTDDGTWFARSGSVMVLFAVIVEHLLSKIKTHTYSPNAFVNSKPVMLDRDMESRYFITKYIAHIYIVIGTLIWGYGDCITASTNTCY